QPEPPVGRDRAATGQRKTEMVDQQRALFELYCQFELLQALRAPEQALDLERQTAAQLRWQGKTRPLQSPRLQEGVQVQKASHQIHIEDLAAAGPQLRPALQPAVRDVHLQTFQRNLTRPPGDRGTRGQLSCQVEPCSVRPGDGINDG